MCKIKPSLASDKLIDVFSRTLADNYEKLKADWHEFLEPAGVKLPSIDLDHPSKKVLVLTWLHYCSKLNLKTDQNQVQWLLTSYFPTIGEASGVQRGLFGDGYLIYSGKRGNDIHDLYGLECSEYFLDIYKPNKKFSASRRSTSGLDWEGIIDLYDHKCATCGCSEGSEMSDGRLCKLQKGHMNPRLSMSNDNVIPQCQKCNEQYKDKFEFTKNGQIKTVASASALEGASEDVLDEILSWIDNKRKSK